MNTTVTPLPCPESPLRRLDPRWKLAGLVAAALAAASLRTLAAAVAALAAALLLAALGRMPLRWYLVRLGGVAVFVGPYAALLPLLTPAAAGPSGELAGLHVSYPGLRAAGVLLCKALTLVTLVLVALVSTPLADLWKALHALRVPGLLVQLLALSYRYSFLLAGELARLRVALRVRGYRHRASRRGYRTAGLVAGTLLVRGFEQAERVGQAMRCRGFDGRYRSLSNFRTRPADLAVFGLIVAVAAGLVIADLARR